ncbi:hypothetical protein CC79DRAFT_1330319 [Sarocladium strictum]
MKATARPRYLLASTPSLATTGPVASDVLLEHGNVARLSTAGKIAAIGTIIPLVVILAIAGFLFS